jgi:asparagine synthase (glutamine-hydrolysing)
MAEEPCRRYQRLTTCLGDALRVELYADDFAGVLSGYDSAEFLVDSFECSRRRDLVTRAGLADLAGYLPADILVKVDVASMAHGLECRSPFLDHHVVELAARMPVRLKMRGFQGKWILRHVFRDLLPERIVRRPKMGFAVPLGDWLRGPLRQQLNETLTDPSSLDRGYFRTSALHQMIDEHMSGMWDHSARLWSLLILEHWHRKFVDEAAREAAEAVEPECVCRG